MPSRLDKPTAAVRINWAHPLARGLQFFSLFRPTDPTGGIDLVRGFAGVATNAPSRSTRGFRQPGNTAYTTWASAQVGGDGPYMASTGLTLCWRGVVASGASHHSFFSKYDANALTPCVFEFRTEAAGTDIFARRCPAAGNRDFASATGVLTFGEVTDVMLTFADNIVTTVPLGYKNGVSFTLTNTSGGGTGVAIGSSFPLQMGLRGGVNDLPLNGEIVHAAIWSRPLSAAEVLAFYASPYAMLQTVIVYDRRNFASFVPPAAGGATAPGPPTGATATAGNAQATVTFTAPASDGGSAITGYTVTSSPAGGTDTNAGSTSLSHLVTGLTNGTPYTFTVTATNAIGTSTPSAASNSVTPATVPDAPTGATATPGNTQASVTFTPPVSTGGSAITGYTVTSSPAGGTDSNAGSTLTTHVVTGLTNGVAYTFTVTATNAIGTSVPSAPSNSVTPATVPGAPTGPVAAAGNTIAVVSFTPPASDGGSAITGYTVTSSPAGGTDVNAGSTATTHVITGLTNGTPYTFTVTATNAIGTGPASVASNSVTPTAGAGGATGTTQRRRWLYHRSSA